MIDSGSVVTGANADKVFPNHPVHASKAQKEGVVYTSASGGTMPNLGEVKVDLVAEHGTKLENLKWQNVDVNVPILSVKHLARKGAKVTFWNGGGVVKLPNKDRIPFWETGGVYFVKMKKLPPPGSEQPPFGGHGS